MFLTVLFFVLFYNISSAQVQYVSPINQKANELMIEALKERTAQYENNLEVINSLLKWIGDLKSKETDLDFLNAINSYQNKLEKLLTDNADLALEKNNLILIENGINNEISKYNQRLAEITNKFKEENSPTKIYEEGISRLKKEDVSGALVSFKRVTEIAPEFAGGHFYTGLCYYEQGKYSVALSYFTKAISLDPQPITYSYKGWSEYNINNFIQAIQDFTWQIENSKPDDPIGYYNRGSAKSELGDFWGALSDYQKAIEIQPDFSMAYNNLGWLYYKKNDFINALKYVNKSIEIDSHNSIAFDSRAEIKFKMKDYNGTIIDCNNALKINSKLANSYFIRGRALYHLGKKIEACQDWSLAGQLGKTEVYDYITKYCK